MDKTLCRSIRLLLTPGTSTWKAVKTIAKLAGRVGVIWRDYVRTSTISLTRKFFIIDRIYQVLIGKSKISRVREVASFSVCLDSS